MRRFAWKVCLGVLVCAGTVPRAQVPQQSIPPAPGTGDQPTFRAGTRLATIDAVVVDKAGHPVTDLTSADFEVVEHGKRQTVRQVLYVRAGAGAGAPAATATAPGPAPSSSPAAPPAASPRGLSLRQPAGRVIAIVVDDLGLSFMSAARVRKMLGTYVETKLAPGDLVAIIRTSGGSGALQQFTTDQRLLRAAAERVRWTSTSRQGIGPFKAVQPAALGGDPSAGSVSELGARNLDRNRRSDTYDEARDDLTSRGTLGALQYVMRGIASLPGRKSVVFISEGFDLGLRGDLSSLAWDAFTRVVSYANRAGVVVYTLDPRGLEGAGLTAEDIVQVNQGGEGLGTVVANAQRARRATLDETQDSLIYLAQQTGGFAVVNANNGVQGLTRITDDLSGYYMIGIETSLDAAARWNPDDVRLKVTRPGLTLRARRGLFGPADATRAPDATPPDPLAAAILSPFTVGAIDMRLAALFGHDATSGSYLRARFSIDPAQIRFVDGPDGRRDADLGMLLMAVDENGAPIAIKRWRVELRLAPDAYRTLQREGLGYSANLPIKAPGGYQLRAAVVDDRSKDVGTVAQFVEVPKVGKGRVALSGVVVMDVEAARRAAGMAGTASPNAEGAGASAPGEAAIGVFTPGTEVVYAAELYDGRGRGDELAAQTTLLRDGTPLYTTPPTPLAQAGGDKKQPVTALPVTGHLTLGRTFPPGSYSLQISVAPRTGTARPRTTQWVDFEVR